jgi:hypothetical protein
MAAIDRDSVRPLGPPPRRARFRRGIRNLRRAYRTVFALVIVVFGGWVVLDAVRLHEATVADAAPMGNPYFLMICRGLLALLALAVLLWIERSLFLELRLARRGEVAQGQILATGKGRRRRTRDWITYTFQTSSGTTIQGRCAVPRATHAEKRVPGTTIEVLYFPGKPQMNKPRLGLDFVEFIKRELSNAEDGENAERRQ